MPKLHPDALLLSDLADRLLYVAATSGPIDEMDRALLARCWDAGWRPLKPEAIDVLREIVGKRRIERALRGDAS